jgi:hypothetical protein
MNYVIKLVLCSARLGGVQIQLAADLSAQLSGRQSESMAADVVGGAIYANTAGRLGSLAYGGARSG